MKGTQRALRFLLCVLLIAGASMPVAYGQLSSTRAENVRTNLKRANLRSSAPQRQIKLQLFFTNQNHPDFANTCGAGEFVERKITPTRRLADAALRLLFAGPTAGEKAKGMEGLPQLGRYYLGVSIKRGVAILNFRPGAEEFLYTNGPACMQEKILTPISKTLKQFATIKTIDYAINGKIIEEWDAE